MPFLSSQAWDQVQQVKHYGLRQQSVRTVLNAEDPLPPLCVVVSKEVLADIEKSDKVKYLIGLLHDPNIQLDYYSDNGPPADAEPISGRPGTVARKGWLTLSPDQKSVTRATETSITTSCLGLGNLLEIFDAKELSRPYSALGSEAGRERRLLDILAGMAAEAVTADVLITRRAILLSPPFNFLKGLVALDVDDALSMVGLYLRQQGRFIVEKDPTGGLTDSFNRGLFYWVGARELLPSGWRWMSACVQHDFGASGQSDRLTLLAGALHSRIQRVLQDRDRLNVMLLAPQDNDTADEALNALDCILLNLMATFDISAVVATEALGLNIRGMNIAWQRGLSRHVATLAPSLFDAVKSGSKGSNLLTILSKMRNSVHGEGLGSLTVRGAMQNRGTLVGLPRRDASDILSAVEAMGGKVAWGLQEILPGRIHADPGVFVERMLVEVMEVLNSILLHTPVERLQHVNLTSKDLLPPNETSSPFDKIAREHIRWQLGL